MKNPPAFPMPSGPEPRINDATHYNEGMSLLDYFAGQALAGLVASKFQDIRSEEDFDAFVRITWNIAEAMLAEREKRLSKLEVKP